MVSKERQHLFDHYYKKLFGDVEIDRSMELNNLDKEHKIDVILRIPGPIIRRTITKVAYSCQEKGHDYTYTNNYVTITMNAHKYNEIRGHYDIGRGELWDSIAQYHVIGYYNQNVDDLAVFVVCNTVALKDYIQNNIEIDGNKKPIGSNIKYNKSNDNIFIHINIGEILVCDKHLNTGIIKHIIVNDDKIQEKISKDYAEASKRILSSLAPGNDSVN